MDPKHNGPTTRAGSLARLRTATGALPAQGRPPLARGALFYGLVLIVLAGAAFTVSRVHSAALAPTPAPCATWSPTSGSYHVQLCIAAPAAGGTLTGDSPVTVTTSITGSGPAVRRVIFHLDGAYLLSDYEPPYTFTLPTAQWGDGTHTLAAQVVMMDGFTSRGATVSLDFHNGTHTTGSALASFQPTSGRPSGGGPFVVAAAGDGASGEGSASRVVARIGAINPNLFLYLGDIYEQGSAAEFFNWYGSGTRFFGTLRAITDPTVGNHEYLSPGAKPYFDYWGRVPSYYSFNAHGWHFISLNSNDQYEPDGPGSPQYKWLQNDLAAQPPNTCTIAYYHHPLFNIGREAPAAWMSPMWQLMAQAGVKIVLNGHDHDYQRWKPLDAAGTLSPDGITEFVVGSGGHDLQTFTKRDPRVAFAMDKHPQTFGALLLQLDASGAAFRYIDAAGSVLDSGTVPCAAPGG